MPAFALSPTVRRQARILAGLKLRPGPSPVQSPNRWAPDGGSAAPSSASSSTTALAIPGQKLPARVDRLFSTSYIGDLELWREGTRYALVACSFLLRSFLTKTLLPDLCSPPTSYMTVASPVYSPIY